MSDTINAKDNKYGNAGSRTRKLIFFGLILLVVALIAYAVAVSLSASNDTGGRTPLAQASGVEVGGSLVGKPVPNFTLTSIGSPSVAFKLSQFIGHPIVLNFFASWCIPCKTELPEFAALSKSESGKVEFLGVDENDTRTAGSAILSQSGVGYPTAFDGSGKLAKAYHLIGLPTTLFINSKGVVVEDIAGQITSSMLSADIAKIIGS